MEVVLFLLFVHLMFNLHNALFKKKNHLVFAHDQVPYIISLLFFLSCVFVLFLT
jgi:hypothetical protein